MFLSKKALMQDMGLYDRHSADSPLLKDFAKFLEQDLSVRNFKQEVRTILKHFANAIIILIKYN